MILRAIVILLLGAATVFAQPAPEEPSDPKAKAHWDRAEARYYAGDLAIAIAEYKAGYAIEPKRIFLFALAQAERKSGNCEAGDAYLKQFFATELTDAQRTASQELIDKVPCAAKEPPPPPPPVVKPPPPPPPPPTRAWFRDPLGGVLTGVGLATLGVGIGFGMSSRTAIENAPSAPTIDAYEAKIDTGRSRETIAKVVIPVGAALIAAGVIRYVLVGRSTPERPRALIGWLVEGGGGFGVMGRL